jgi:hypothetical protein
MRTLWTLSGHRARIRADEVSRALSLDPIGSGSGPRAFIRREATDSADTAGLCLRKIATGLHQGFFFWSRRLGQATVRASWSRGYGDPLELGRERLR